MKYAMKKKFILFDILFGQVFIGSDYAGVPSFEDYRAGDKPKTFNSEEEATKRLQSEMSDYPKYFTGRGIIVMPVYLINEQ